MRLDGTGSIDPAWELDASGLDGEVVDVVDGDDGTFVVAAGSLGQFDAAGHPVTEFGVDGTAALADLAATGGTLLDDRIVLVGVVDGATVARSYEPAPPDGTAVVVVEDPTDPVPEDPGEEASTPDASSTTVVAPGSSTTVPVETCSAGEVPANRDALDDHRAPVGVPDPAPLATAPAQP